ncbi:MAG: DNA-deoxyinosine glycosylase [Bacteroidota bacterium]
MNAIGERTLSIIPNQENIMGINSFNPIVNERSKVLILGSMPGKDSLNKKEYYGNKRNMFWNLMFGILKAGQTENYEEKKMMLLNNNIALWDVLASCDRVGSQDKNIKNAAVNDFGAFYRKYSNISVVFFNGKNAYKYYQKLVGFNNKRIFKSLPSTSPLNTRYKFNKKKEKWAMIKDYL